MKLNEVKRLILQHEIRLPVNDSEKFNDENNLVDPNFQFGKNPTATEAAFALVRAAGERYRYGALKLPL